MLAFSSDIKEKKCEVRGNHQKYLQGSQWYHKKFPDTSIAAMSPLVAKSCNSNKKL